MIASIILQKLINDNIEQIYHLIDIYCTTEQKKDIEDNPQMFNYIPFIAGLIWPYVLYIYINSKIKDNNDNRYS